MIYIDRTQVLSSSDQITFIILPLTAFSTEHYSHVPMPQWVCVGGCVSLQFYMHESFALHLRRNGLGSWVRVRACAAHGLENEISKKIRRKRMEMSELRISWNYQTRFISYTQRVHVPDISTYLSNKTVWSTKDYT